MNVVSVLVFGVVVLALVAGCAVLALVADLAQRISEMGAAAGVEATAAYGAEQWSAQQTAQAGGRP